jgi:hypothetical protein
MLTWKYKIGIMLKRSARPKRAADGAFFFMGCAFWALLFVAAPFSFDFEEKQS